MSESGSVCFERLSPGFSKHHLNLDGFRAAVHRFTEPDRGDPHDHPASFTTHILTGGYIEDVYTLKPDGGWSVERIRRNPGTSHRVWATTIHRIVELPHGECRTLVMMDAHERVSRFWRFGDQIESRAWNETEFTPFSSSSAPAQRSTSSQPAHE